MHAGGKENCFRVCGDSLPSFCIFRSSSLSRRGPAEHLPAKWHKQDSRGHLDTGRRYSVCSWKSLCVRRWQVAAGPPVMEDLEARAAGGAQRPGPRRLVQGSMGRWAERRRGEGRGGVRPHLVPGAQPPLPVTPEVGGVCGTPGLRESHVGRLRV